MRSPSDGVSPLHACVRGPGNPVPIGLETYDAGKVPQRDLGTLNSEIAGRGGFLFQEAFSNPPPLAIPPPLLFFS